MDKKLNLNAEETKEAIEEAVQKATEVTTETAKEVAKAASEVLKETTDKALKLAEEKAPKQTKAAKDAASKAAKKAKKTVQDITPVQETYFEVNGEQILAEEIIAKVKAAYKADGHRVSYIRSLKTYIIPEERKAYYVINDKAEGKFVEF